MSSICVSDLTIYEPSPENLSESPKLEFCDPLFKRRLSQISKMTIQVVHDLIEKNPSAKDSKLVFASFRGELARQLKINKGLVEDGDVMPAQFSISVFNTPPAASTIACGIKAGYTAVYPSKDNFNDALISACAPVLAECEKQIVFVYADENVIDEYKNNYFDADGKKTTAPAPIAFACVLKKADNNSEKIIELPFNFLSPRDFLKFIDS